MKARGWNRAFHAAHGNTLIELLFLVVGMFVLSVTGAASAKMPSSDQLNFAATGRVKEHIVDTRTDVWVASPSCVDSAGRYLKITVGTRTEVRVAISAVNSAGCRRKNTMETRMEERVVSPSCVDSAGRRTLQATVETRTEVRGVSPSCVDSASCRPLQSTVKTRRREARPRPRQKSRRTLQSIVKTRTE